MVSSAPRRAGVSKARAHKRVDRDGDLLMGAAPVPKAVVRAPPPRGPRNNKTAELKVVGWKNQPSDKSVSDLLNFLNRHALKRSTRRVSHKNPLIKSHREIGDALFICIQQEDVDAFMKLNQFSFGENKLTITEEIDPALEEKSTETKALLQDLLQRRYNPATKVLDLSTLGSDPKLKEIGMFEGHVRQTEFFAALMKVCDDQFKTPQEKKDTVTSVSLANNALSSTTMLLPLALTFPDLIAIDLSDNKFSTTRDLSGWRNRFPNLDLLVLTGNPITSDTQYEKILTSWFPRLRTLNTTQVRSDVEIALIDRPKETPVPSSAANWNDIDGVAERFVLDFFAGFDNDRPGLLAKYYDDTSKFSLTVNAAAKGGAAQHERTPWDAYIKSSRNLKIINNPKTRHIRQNIGASHIATRWNAFPPTRHPNFQTELQKYCLECSPQDGLPDPTGQHPGVTGLLVIVHGEFEEHFTERGQNVIVHRAFDRTFVLGPGGATGIRVINDMWQLRAYGGVPAWIPNANTANGPVTNCATTTPAQIAAPSDNPIAKLAPEQQKAIQESGLTVEQQKMLVELHFASTMNLDFSKQCLDSAGWVAEAAWNLFLQQKANLGPEAFV